MITLNEARRLIAELAKHRRRCLQCKTALSKALGNDGHCKCAQRMIAEITSNLDVFVGDIFKKP